MSPYMSIILDCESELSNLTCGAIVSFMMGLAGGFWNIID